MSLFLNPKDFIYARLKGSMSYFGFNPHLYFNASVAADILRHDPFHPPKEKHWIPSFFKFFLEITDAFARTSSISSTGRGSIPVGFESLAAEFYDSIATTPNAGSLRAGMFETQVL